MVRRKLNAVGRFVRYGYCLDLYYYYHFIFSKGGLNRFSRGLGKGSERAFDRSGLLQCMLKLLPSS